MITCAFRFHIHYLFIYLFIQSDVNKSSASHHLFVFTYENYLLITCAFSFHIHYLFIYLFIQSDVNKSNASHHLFLFTYVNWLLITCVFCLNIYYLFVYLFKAMSTKAGGSDHLFLFTYGNHLLLIMVFVLIFIICYLFIQSDVNKTRWKRPPVFIYLWKSLVVRHDFHLNTQYLFIYLFIQSDINKSRWNWPPLFTYASHLLWDMVFVWIFSNYSFIYSKRCQQKQVEETTCLYVFFSESEQFRLSYSMLGLTFKNIFLHNCDGNVSKRKTKRKLKSSWNREVHCERKKSTEDKLHKMWKSNYFCKKTAKRAHPCTKSAVHIFLYKKMNIYY